MTLNSLSKIQVCKLPTRLGETGKLRSSKLKAQVGGVWFRRRGVTSGVEDRFRRLMGMRDREAHFTIRRMTNMLKQ